MENSLKFLKHLKTELQYDPTITLLGIRPKEMNPGSWGDICISLFIAALLTLDGKDDVAYIYNGILFSQLK